MNRKNQVMNIIQFNEHTDTDASFNASAENTKQQKKS